MSEDATFDFEALFQYGPSNALIALLSREKPLSAKEIIEFICYLFAEEVKYPNNPYEPNPSQFDVLGAYLNQKYRDEEYDEQVLEALTEFLVKYCCNRYQGFSEKHVVFADDSNCLEMKNFMGPNPCPLIRQAVTDTISLTDSVGRPFHQHLMKHPL